MTWLAMELERTGVHAGGRSPGHGRLGRHHVQDADPPRLAFDDLAAAGTTGGYVFGHDRRNADAVEFHRLRIVAGRSKKVRMDDKEEVPPAEAARERRRDRDAEARSRAGMRTGLAKQFKQVLDAQRKRA